MRIDSHQHFWRLARGDYGWISAELGPIYRDFLPADLDELRHQANIDKTIMVQAADTVAETEFLLDLLPKPCGWRGVAGFVGWVDMESERAVDTLNRLANDPRHRIR